MQRDTLWDCEKKLTCCTLCLASLANTLGVIHPAKPSTHLTREASACHTGSTLTLPPAAMLRLTTSRQHSVTLRWGGGQGQRAVRGAAG